MHIPSPHCFRSAPLLYKKAEAETLTGSKEGNENYMGCGLRREGRKKSKAEMT